MKQKPNILLVLVDQMRGDCLGLEQKHPVLTPVIDSIAGAGARFTKAYSSCPTCIAARRSILSGKQPSNHGMVGYEEGVEWQEEVTLPAILKENGYQTYLVGRDMHQHPKRKRFGYDQMVILNDYTKWVTGKLPDVCSASVQFHSGSPSHETGIKHNDWTARPWPFDEQLHPTNWTVNEAKKFFETRDPTVPWFLTVSFLAPHPPLIPPAFYMERYLRTGVTQPVIGDWATPPENKGFGLDPGITSVQLQDEKLLSARAAYYGLINHLDDQLRRIINPIDGISLLNDENSGNLVNGLKRDTIVIFTSDHGEMLGDHYSWHKMLPYEGSSRIPFLVSAPDEFGIKNNTVIDELVCLEDLMPTILDIAGIEIPNSVDGKSLLRVLQGENEKVREYLHMEHAPLHQTIINDSFKYIWYVEDGEEQLFDIKNDPDELKNLADEKNCREILLKLRRVLVKELQNRPEGFSDGIKLIPGKLYRPVIPK